MKPTKSTEEITHLHGSELVPRHHFQHVLERIDTDTIEIQELCEIIEQSDDSVNLILSEAAATAQQSHFHHEIRSLRHAILLLGMRKVHHILNEYNESAALAFLKSA